MIVRSIIDKTSAVEIITHELKVQLLKIPAIDVMMDDSTSPLMIAMQRTATSLAKCYTGESRKILYPTMML